MAIQDRSQKGHRAVFGIFKDRQNLDRAVQTLRDRGFRGTDISVLLPAEGTNESFAHEKATKAPEGATTGATGGLVLGGALGWLVGAGALAIPGIGPFVAAGPILASLAGAGIGGTIGGVSGAMIGLGIPEYEAKRYEGMVKEGGHLLSVHVDDATWASRAKDVLESSGAEDIASSWEKDARSSSAEPTKTEENNASWDQRPLI